MPVVQDFVPIEEDYERAGTVLVEDFGSWLTEPAEVALAGSEGVSIAFDDPRMIERDLVVGLRWTAGTGPFATLDADLRLEPMPEPRSHLSLSGTYAASSPDASVQDTATDQHLTETRVRHFLVGVAATLERGRSEN